MHQAASWMMRNHSEVGQFLLLWATYDEAGSEMGLTVPALAASFLGCAPGARSDGDVEGVDGREPKRSPHVVVAEPGVRPLVQRDCTEKFKRMRNARHSRGMRRAAARHICGDCAAELDAIYGEVVLTHASLAAEIAQHNGLKQFVIDFKSRASPLEFRALLPGLEASIDKRLMALQALVGRLQALNFPAGSANQRICENAMQNASRLYAETRSAFAEQRCALQDIAVTLPHLTPVLSPLLNQRIVAAIGSPGSSSPSTCKKAESSPSSSTISGRLPYVDRCVVKTAHGMPLSHLSRRLRSMSTNTNGGSSSPESAASPVQSSTFSPFSAPRSPQSGTALRFSEAMAESDSEDDGARGDHRPFESIFNFQMKIEESPRHAV